MSGMTPKFKSPLSIQQQGNGTIVVIEGVIESDPKPECQWLFHDEPVDTSSGRITVKLEQLAPTEYKTVLRITSVDGSDGGTYRLFAKNSLGKLKANVNLQFQEDDNASGRKPCFTQQPKITQDDNDNKVVFECGLTADPSPTYSWYKDNMLITSGGRYSMKSQSLPNNVYVTSCSVIGITGTDAGTYKVVATNEFGESSATMNLNFDDGTGRPEIASDILIRPSIDKRDETIIIECHCTAGTLPEFVWYFNDRTLDTTQAKYNMSYIQTSVNKYTCLLAIKNVTKNDSGRYKLVARNQRGEHAANIALDLSTITGKPSASAYSPKCVGSATYSKQGNDWILTIKFASNPAPSVDWKRAGLKIISEKYEKMMSKSDGDIYICQLRVKDATAKDASLYECTAFNEYGSCKVNIELEYKDNHLYKVGRESELPMFDNPVVRYDPNKNVVEIRRVIKSKDDVDTSFQKNKATIKYGSKYKYKTTRSQENQEAVLQIMNYTPENDSGNYKMSHVWDSGNAISNVVINTDDAKVSTFELDEDDEEEIEIVVDSQPAQNVDEAPRRLSSTIQIPVENSGQESLLLDFTDKKAKPGDKKPSDSPKPTKRLSAAGKKPSDDKPVEVGKVTTRLSITTAEPTDMQSPQVGTRSHVTGMKKPETKTKDSGKPVNAEPAGVKPDDVKLPDAKNPSRTSLTGQKLGEKTLAESSEMSSQAAVSGRKTSTEKPLGAKTSEPTEKKPDDAKTKGKTTVKQPDTGKKPTFISDMKPLLTKDGDEVTLKFNVAGKIPMKVTWTVDGKPLPDTTQYEQSVDGNTVQLKILDGYVEDSGTYGCIVENDFGKEQKTCKVTVQPKNPTKPSRKKPEFSAKPAAVVEGTMSLPPARVGATKPTSIKGKLDANEKPDVQPRSDKPAVSKETVTETNLETLEATGTVANVPEVKSPAPGLPASKVTATKPEKMEEKPGLRRAKGPPTLRKATGVSGIEKNVSKATVINTDQPSWPTLKKTTVAKKVPDHWTTHLIDSKGNEADGTTTLAATFCRAGGKLRWYKNRVEIFHGQKYNFITEGPVQKLQINKLIPDDSGRYICSVNDVETKGWLEVEAAKPEYDFYMQLPTKYEVFRTKPVVLECHVNNPDTPIKWLKGGKPLPEDEKQFKTYLDSTRCVLRIIRAGRVHQDTYSCVIDDGSGKECTCYLYVQEPQWRFSKKMPRKMEVPEKKDMVLEVEVEDPDAECEWFHDGEAIPLDDLPNEKFEVVVEGKKRRLIVKNATPKKDDGNWECKTGMMTTSCSISVQENLRMVEALKDSEVQENVDVIMSIELNMPRANVIWMKDNKRILPGPNNLILNKGKTHSVTLKAVSLDDTGRYGVKVDNLTSECNISVREADEPPTMDIGMIPKSLSITVGKPLQIKVPFHGTPTPEVTWLKDGQPVDIKVVRIETEHNGSTLQIPVCKQEDAGKYTIALKNPLGETTANIEVSVCDRPGTPVGPVRVSDVTRMKCTLSWQPPESDGGSPLTGYIIEKLDTSRGDWVEAISVGPNKTLVDVPKLSAGKEYKFRVRSLNKIGTSEPLEMTKPVIAKDPYDKSSPPGPLTVTDKDGTYVSLAWTPPASDGGSPIEKYMVEKQEEGKEWSKVAEVGPDDLAYKVQNLKSDKPYNFRVFAVNKAGPSEPSTIDKPVVPEPKLVRPMIKRGAMKDMTVKKSQRVVISAPYSARPQPEYVWQKDGQDLVVDDKFQVTFTDKLCELTIKDSLRADKGVYTLKLTNAAGSDSGKCLVVVLGPPDQPRGPLKVSDVTKTAVLLSWETPADDGGKPVQSYVIEKKDGAFGEWSRVGTTSQTSFKVPKLNTGHEYEFRVFAENQEGTGEPLISDGPTLVKDPYDPPGPPNIPVIVSRDRKHIGVSWEPPADDGGAPVIGYVLERKEPHKDEWITVNASEMITGNEYVDKRVVADQPYEYRVKAINDAGPGSPSHSTGTVLAQPEKEKPSIDQSSLPGALGNKEIKIRAGESLTIDLKILGTPKPTVDWTKDNKPLSLPGGELKSDDKHVLVNVPSAQRSDSGMYHVSVKNDLGEDEADVKVIVLDVPSPCMGPVKIEETGNDFITLSWDPPEDNGGTPLDGYVIEKCLEGSTEWEPVGETSYQPKITAKNLKPKAKYNFRIMAKNQLGLSKPLQTTVPVLVKPPYDPPSSPSPPEITDFDSDRISISWEKPASDGGNPIAGYLVEMKDNKGEWEPCNSIPVKGQQFTASPLKPGHMYEFRVKAVNEAGPGDVSRPSNGQRAESPITPPAAPEQVNLDTVDKNSAAISWRPPKDDGGEKVASYIVESRTDGGDWTQVGQVAGRERSLKIPNLKENSDVSFRVRAVNSSGPGEASVPTTVATVQDPPCAPSFLDMTKIKDIVVKAGSGFSTSAQFKAQPAPSIDCSNGDMPIINDDRCQTKVHDDQISIAVSDCRRQDSGIYKVTLRNSVGTTTASFRVTVLDAPGKPSGPVDVSNVDVDRCTLKWSAPEDDGGSPVVGYVVEKRKVGSDRWKKAGPATASPSMTITGLNNGDQYEFRVMAENVNGKSEPLLVDDPVLIKSPFKKPDSPESIQCVDHTENSVSLKWAKPSSDGGTPITGYVIQRRDGTDGDWKPVTRQPGTDNHCTVSGLTEGKPYMFRVAAVNAAGQSSWSECEEPIVPRPPDAAPVVNDTTSKTITVKVGESLTIPINFTASPIPTAVFSKDGISVSGDQNHIVTVDSEKALFKVPSAELSDAGSYQCTLKNAIGQTTANITVNVIGKPSSPQGPIVVTDPSPYGCKLAWEAPQSNGGSPITNFVLEKCDTKTGIWTPVSKYCREPCFEVFDLDKDHEYQFRVSAVNEAGQSEPLETDKPMVARYAASKPKSPQDFRVAENEYDYTRLEWEPPTKDGGSRITGYLVEVKPSDSEEWEPVVVEPTKDTHLTVDHLLPSKTYEFRVSAINAIGKSNPCDLHSPLKVKPAPRPPAAPLSPECLSVGEGFTQLVWEPPIDDGGSPISAYKLEMKLPGKTDWQPAVSSLLHDNTETVSGLPPNAEVEFRVKAISIFGESEWSAPSDKIRVTGYPDGKPPEFTTTLKDTKSSSGSQTAFSVNFTGNPEPEVKWCRNGMEITPGHKYIINTKPGQSTLSIMDVWETDDGTQFSCVIQNPVGSDVTTCKLQVRKPPSAGKFDNHIHVVKDETAVLKIPIEGARDLDIKLKKLGADSYENEATEDKIDISDVNGVITLKLKDAQVLDSGDFELIVSNGDGTTNIPFEIRVSGAPGKPEGPLEAFDVTKEGCKLFWKPPLDDGASRITHYVVEKHDIAKPADNWIEVNGVCKDTTLAIDRLLEGHQYEFRVMAVNSEGQSEPLFSSSTVTPQLPFGPPKATGVPSVQQIDTSSVKLSWPKAQTDPGSGPVTYHIEKKSKDSDVWRPVNVGSSMLLTSAEIPGLVTGEEYEFRVIAENEAGMSPPSEATEAFKVKDPFGDGAPELIKKIEDVTVNEGHTAKFEAEFNAAPDSEIIWMKGDIELHSGADFTVSKSSTGSTLVVNNAHFADNDEMITLKVKNKSGSRSCRAKMAVRAKPRIKFPHRLKETQEYTENDNEIVIKLPFVSNPAPDVIWTVNGSPLSPSSDIEIDTSNHIATLRVKDPNVLGTSGEIKLKLTNPLGEAEAGVNYVVRGPPESPSNLVADAVYDDCVTLSWTPPVRTDAAPITDYRVEKCEGPSGEWVPIGQCRSTRFIAPNLKPDTNYSFRVVAVNPNGCSAPSMPLTDVKTATDESAQPKRKAPYGYDSEGRRMRGLEGQEPSDYDRLYTDIWRSGNPDLPTLNTESVYDKYDILEELGRSPLGAVHRGVDKVTGKNFVVKFIDTPDHEDFNLVNGEIDLMSDIMDPNIVSMKEAFQSTEETAMVYEMLTGDSLPDQMAGGKMTEPEAIRLVRQICKAVKSMHDNHIVHLDLKPESFVATTKRSPESIKLTDFSLAQKLLPNESVQVSLASVDFASPEIVSHDSVGFYTDMWAVGALAYAILSGESPFHGPNNEETSKKIQKADLNFPSKHFDGISDNAKNFISGLLKKNKVSRMTIDEALDHPWLTPESEKVEGSSMSPNYNGLQDLTRNKYKNYTKEEYPEPKLGIGRSAWYSREARRHPRTFNLYDTNFDRREFTPRLYIFKHNSYVLEGETAELHGRIISLTTPSVSWSRAGNEIRHSSKISKRSNAHIYTLEIRKCTMDDGGEYEISASNQYGNRNAIITLYVEEVKEKSTPKLESKQKEHVRKEYTLIDVWQAPNKAPVFTHALRTRVLQKNMSVKLSCTVTGRPNPKVSWFKGNVDISNDFHYNTKYNNGVAMLEIMRARTDDTATYHCQAENKSGRAETVCQIIVQGSGRRSRELSVKQPEYEETVTTRRSSIYRDSVTSIDEYSSNSSSSSRRKKVQFESNAEFGETGLPPVKQRRKSTITPVAIVQNLSPLTLYVGGILQLKCVVSGRPKPEIQWLKDGQEVYASERILHSFEQNTATLTIESARLFDSGEYRIIAINEAGSVSSSAEIVVKALTTQGENGIDETDREHEELKSSEITQSSVKIIEGEEISSTVSEQDVSETDQGMVEHSSTKQSTLTSSRRSTKESMTAKKISAEHVSAEKQAPAVTFKKHVNSSYLDNGLALTLECELAGATESIKQIEWTRNNRIIPENPDFIKRQEGNKLTLYVAEVYPEDSGEFGVAITCDDDQVRRSIATIIVPDDEDDQPTVSVLSFMKCMDCNVNEKAKFNVKTVEDCKAVWTREEGVAIDTTLQITTADNGTIHSLEIPSVQLFHDGLIQVELTSKATQANIVLQAYLNVYE